jgi:hypothetical protein
MIEMMEMIPTRPCPFCHTEGPLMKLSEDMFCRIPASRFGPVHYAVGCDEDACRVTGPMRPSMEEAIAAWNGCQPDTPAPRPE